MTEYRKRPELVNRTTFDPPIKFEGDTPIYDNMKNPQSQGKIMENVKAHAKFVAALIGTVVTAGAGLIAPEVLDWIAFIGAILTTVAVYAIPNTPKQ